MTTTWDGDCPVLEVATTDDGGPTEIQTVVRRCDRFGDPGVVDVETLVNDAVAQRSFTQYFPTYPDDPEARRQRDRVESENEVLGPIGGQEVYGPPYGWPDPGSTEYRDYEYDRRNRLVHESRRLDGFTTTLAWSWWRDTSLPTTHTVSFGGNTAAEEWEWQRDRHGRVEVETEQSVDLTETITTWEADRWAPISRRTTQDGMLHETESWTCEPGPLTTCEIDIDIGRGINPPDGSPETRRTVEYDCPG